MHDPLTSAARARPRHLAVVAPGEALSYSALADHAVEAAEEMAALTRTDELAGVNFAILLHAAWIAGGAISPLNPVLPPPPMPTAIRPDTLAVVYTSGTTGEPRPVSLTRTNFEASARASASMLGVHAHDRWLCVLPVFHVGGLSIFTRCAMYATTVVAEPSFDVDRVKGLMESGEVTLVSLVPTMLARLREAGLERAPAVRGILLGGGPIPAELLDWSIEVGLPVMPTYGMTETTSQIATARPGERLARVLAGAYVRIGDGSEIQVSGEMVAADGWLHTGDRGWLTDDGLLEVEGRMDDVIVTGGENVAAREVEEALLAHPGVTDAAVIGVEDAEWGRAVTAFVVAQASENGLLAHCREQLAPFKVPKRIVLLEELPRNAAGKVMRASLESRADDLRQGR